MSLVLTNQGRARGRYAIAGAGAVGTSNSRVEEVPGGRFEKQPTFSEEASEEIPPLGEPRQEKKFWFQRSVDYDPNAIATQVWSLEVRTPR